MRKGILVSYNNVNIFLVYFCLEKKIQQVQDIIFVEKPQDDIFPTTFIYSFSSKKSGNLIIPNQSVLSSISTNSTNFCYHLLIPSY